VLSPVLMEHSASSIVLNLKGRRSKKIQLTTGAVKVKIVTVATVEETRYNNVISIKKELDVYSEGLVAGNHCCSKYMLQGLCELTELCACVSAV